jgi:hypothetical protein
LYNLWYCVSCIAEIAVGLRGLEAEQQLRASEFANSPLYRLPPPRDARLNAELGVRTARYISAPIRHRQIIVRTEL